MNLSSVLHLGGGEGCYRFFTGFIPNSLNANPLFNNHPAFSAGSSPRNWLQSLVAVRVPCRRVKIPRQSPGKHLNWDVPSVFGSFL